MMLVCCGYFAWSRWGAERIGAQFQQIDPTLIEITKPHSFVGGKVVETVFQDTALEEVSLLDQHATAKIASAFSTHPWVKRVVSVRKLPGGGVDVRLEYRHCVAMVVVPKDRKFGFFPIDGEGVLLVADDFSTSDASEFIHILVPDTFPTGDYGMAYGDIRVEAAAKLAAILEPVRTQAGIVSINVPGDLRQNPVPQLELNTKDGQRIFWGSAPGSELPGEPSTAVKLNLLHDQIKAIRTAKLQK
jgi:hypothetical protein